MNDMSPRVMLLVAESNINRANLCERLDGWHRDVGMVATQVAGITSLTMHCIDMIVGVADNQHKKLPASEAQPWWASLLMKGVEVALSKWSASTADVNMKR